MRKQDIKPGVVYAYQESLAYGGGPEPVVFLTAPADGRLYVRRRTWAGKSDPGSRFIQEPEGTKLARRTYREVNGYPVAKLLAGPYDPDELLKVTLADFKAEPYEIDPGDERHFKFATVANLTYIRGPWDEVNAQHEARDRAERERHEMERQAEQASYNRAAAIAGALSKAGIVADSAQRHGLVTHIRLSLDEAEKLARLLSPGAEGEQDHG